MDSFNTFLTLVAAKNLTLYPAQEEAILELYDRKNVILNTPTGSGKSLVAQALHHLALGNKTVSIYTCPIKALVNEKFLALCKEFGPENVGMQTGDASVNVDAPIICCTAEILANRAAREGADLAISDVIMDEFHYYSDRDRGSAWQLPLLILKKTRFLLMSATLGDMDFFAKELTELNGRETAIVASTDRPVPLTFEYRETPLHETLSDLLQTGRAPVYLVNFTQAACAEQAQNLMSLDVCTKDEKRLINEELAGIPFNSPYGKEMQRFLKHGIGIHHAGLLPRYRILNEKLAQKGLLKVICGTDTLGVGVNVPIRTVLFTQLCKYDGQKTAILSVRDFHQIAGRAGRKGFDSQGTVCAQAPEHVIENLKMDMKAKADPKKAKKMVKRQPPQRGYVHYDKATFERLIASKPEPLVSRFDVTHGLLLNVLGREGDGCYAMRDLIRRSHESTDAKKKHFAKGWQLFRSLLERQLIEFTAHGVRVNIDLQEDFSLMNTLSLYILDTLKLLDPESPTFALDLLTLVESILESPELILRQQLSRVKDQAVAEMKAAGVEYDQRMEELEKLEHPKPLRDFIYSTFNSFSEKHPWIGTENIRPKSVAREMFETYASFADYIKEYGLQRAEGLLLRYLSEVVKTLIQTIPDAVKTEAVDDLIIYFAEMIRAVDSSLLDEWQKLRLGEAGAELAGRYRAAAQASQAAIAAEQQRSRRALLVQTRNRIFSFVRALSVGDLEAATTLVPVAIDEFDFAKWSAELLSSHGNIRTDLEARGTHNTLVDANSKPGYWIVSQTLLDSNDFNDTVLEFEIDQAESFQSSALVIKLNGVK